MLVVKKLFKRGLIIFGGLFVLLVAIGVTVTLRLNLFDVMRFNESMQDFNDEYAGLLIERVRLAKLGYEDASLEVIIDQSAKLHKQSDKVIRVLDKLQEQGEKINESELDADDLQVMGVFGEIAFAKEAKKTYRQKYGIVGAILSKIPVIKNLVEGVDAVTESARLGIYKVLVSADEVDREAILADLKKYGIEKPEDILDTSWVNVQGIMRDYETIGGGGEGELLIEAVGRAKSFAKMGKAGVLAYVDGIFAATGVSGMTPDYLPGDLEDFVKILVGGQAWTDYLKTKAINTGMAVLQGAVDPDTTPEQGILMAIKKSLSDLLFGMKLDDVPIGDWTPEQKVAVAEKIQALQKDGPVISVGKIAGEIRGEVRVPEGEYDVVITGGVALPVLLEDVAVEEGKITEVIKVNVPGIGLVSNIEKIRRNLALSKAGKPGEKLDIDEVLVELREDGETPETKNVCVSKWSCTAWGACSTGVQIRTCNDVNGCEPSTGRPSVRQACKEVVKKVVPVCSPSWECGDWLPCKGVKQLRNCKDTNGCGSSAGKPTASQSCEVEKDDGDGDEGAGGTNSWEERNKVIGDGCKAYAGGDASTTGGYTAIIFGNCVMHEGYGFFR